MEGLTASQRMGVYIKALGEKVFRPFSHSDFYNGDDHGDDHHNDTTAIAREADDGDDGDFGGLGDLGAFAFAQAST